MMIATAVDVVLVQIYQLDHGLNGNGAVEGIGAIGVSSELAVWSECDVWSRMVRALQAQKGDV